MEQLYRKYHREIHLYLYSMCRQTDVAKDLTQETFLKALLSLNSNHTNMRAWLYVVARNLYFNYQKKGRRSVSLEDAHIQNDFTSSDLLSDLIQTEEKEVLFQGIQQLSQRKREILQLQYFGGLSQQEISAILRLSPTNVRVLALRARQELKQYLEVHGYDIP